MATQRSNYDTARQGHIKMQGVKSEGNIYSFERFRGNQMLIRWRKLLNFYVSYESGIKYAFLCLYQQLPIFLSQVIIPVKEAESRLLAILSTYLQPHPYPLTPGSLTQKEELCKFNFFFFKWICRSFKRIPYQKKSFYKGKVI